MIVAKKYGKGVQNALQADASIVSFKSGPYYYDDYYSYFYFCFYFYFYYDLFFLLSFFLFLFLFFLVSCFKIV